MEMTRKDFLQTLAGVAATAGISKFSASAEASKAKIKRGVTLYSYTGDFKMGTMNLEDCIADVADMGAEGIEILGESHVTDYPNPSDKWVEQWNGLMNKYRTKPSCYDSFVDSMLRKDKTLTMQETLDMLVRDFKVAKKLGYKIIRPTFGKSPLAVTDVIERSLPLLEQYDLKMAIEMHSPVIIKSEYMDSLMALISKTKTKRFGFATDMSIFTKRPPRHWEAERVEMGAHQNIIDYIRTAYQNNLGPEKTMAEVKKMGGNDVDLQWASIAGVYHFSWNPPKDLLPIMPYIYHIHGKFWEMTEELHEYSIPYEEVIPVLLQGGCEAYFSSEYEGPRTLFRASSQLRRHHAMLRQLLKEV